MLWHVPWWCGCNSSGGRGWEFIVVGEVGRVRLVSASPIWRSQLPGSARLSGSPACRTCSGSGRLRPRTRIPPRLRGRPRAPPGRVVHAWATARVTWNRGRSGASVPLGPRPPARDQHVPPHGGLAELARTGSLNRQTMAWGAPGQGRAQRSTR